jgi:hypothetical protein
LEVTPYRYALIELAKAVGGVFALRVHDKTGESSLGAPATDTTEEEEEPDGSRVTTDDLVKLFGFTPQQAPKYFEIESFTGVMQVPGRHVYQQPGQGGQPAAPTVPGGGGLRGPAGTPRGAPGGMRPGSVPGGAPVRPPTGTRSAGVITASERSIV